MGLRGTQGPDLQRPCGMQYGREFGCFTNLNGVLVKGVAWPHLCFKNRFTWLLHGLGGGQMWRACYWNLRLEHWEASEEIEN